MVKFEKFQRLLKKMKMRQPTLKQFVFARHYVLTGNAYEAYQKAGYMRVDHMIRRRRERAIYRVKQSKTVQQLLYLATHEWQRKTGMTKEGIVNRLLHIADTADNTTDQIAALKEIAALTGHHAYKKLNRKKAA